MFSPSASWIWHGPSDAPHQRVLAFRRSFEIESDPNDAKVRITADSRYELFVNGRSVGQGPPRSWIEPWTVDEYDLGACLRRGENSIAVRVTHFGISTFQYLYARPGLIAQLAYDGQTLASDASWRVATEASFAERVPRIDCQQAWEEQYDANLAPVDAAGRAWWEPGFTEADCETVWSEATVVDAPHTTFEPRRVPALTRRPVPAVVRGELEAVRPAEHVWTADLKPVIDPYDREANVIHAAVMVRLRIRSDADQTIELHELHNPWQWKLNGKALSFDDHTLQLTERGVAHARLRRGSNVLLGRMPAAMHFGQFQLNARVERPISFDTLTAAPASGNGHPAPAAWEVIGPFQPAAPGGAASAMIANSRELTTAKELAPSATPHRFEAIWAAGDASREDEDAGLVRPMPEFCVKPVDVFGVCGSERRTDAGRPRWNDPEAMTRDDETSTRIEPDPRADARFLLDFQREVVGYHEFELEAAAGTVIDFHVFEFIQPLSAEAHRSGRINLCTGMNNTFRYVCREGHQRYRTLLRRGGRYAWVSIRNAARPVSIQGVRLIESTAPLSDRGAFRSSDSLLDRAYEVSRQTLRCCAEDTYTDCPTYEQVYWVGDARNESLVDLSLNGDATLSEHCWRQAARSLARNPLVESHVPSGFQGLIPTWSFLWMRWAWEHFIFTGDEAFAEEALDWIARQVDNLAGMIGDDGLIDLHAWNLFDWADMDTPADAKVCHVNCFAVRGLEDTANLAEKMNQHERARSWRAMAQSLREATDRAFWSENERAYRDCIRVDGAPSDVFSQQTQTAAYLAGIGDRDRASRCRALITDPPPHFVVSGSPFFLFFVFEVLAEEGETGEMLEQIRRGVGPQIEAGATTFWERFHPHAERMTRSHCHAWSAGPGYFLPRYALGVRPAAPGWAEALIEPRPDVLRFAEGVVPTPRGDIACGWRSEGGKLRIEIRLPETIEARIRLPFEGTCHLERGTRRRAEGNEICVAGPEVALTIEPMDAVAAGR